MASASFGHVCCHNGEVVFSAYTAYYLMQYLLMGKANLWEERWKEKTLQMKNSGREWHVERQATVAGNGNAGDHDYCQRSFRLLALAKGVLKGLDREALCLMSQEQLERHVERFAAGGLAGAVQPPAH